MEVLGVVTKPGPGKPRGKGPGSGFVLCDAIFVYFFPTGEIRLHGKRAEPRGDTSPAFRRVTCRPESARLRSFARLSFDCAPPVESLPGASVFTCCATSHRPRKESLQLHRGWVFVQGPDPVDACLMTRANTLTSPLAFWPNWRKP